MSARLDLDAKAISLMVVLCAIWGLQQVVLKATADDIAPIMQIGLRSGVAALLVGLVMWWRKEPMNLRDGTLRPGVAVALLFGVEFLLVAEGLRHTSASHMVVFLYTAPMFAALGLHWKLPAERLGAVQWLGIVLAFGGIAYAFLGRSTASSALPGNALWGDFLGLLGGVAWAATTVVVRCSSLSRAPATQTLLYQLIGAFVLLLAGAFLTGQARFNPTPQVWASLAFHSVVVSFASFLMWFWLLRHYLASPLGVFSFLTPLFGIVFGAWLLSEPIEPSFLLGAIPVLVGIVLVSGGGWLMQQWARKLRANETVKS
ncbi:DMT family transporter [Rhodoferax sp.]|uniref:DMT family transporter n=1 Tax=Rhodoferax sp. TaxID=50421 RepID=UPI002717E14E|nr:DMT family transporter [Rhodoferax sp.]MDO9144231.1 DMT family transporter [Rhodoferax sp.]MDP1530566.1 DMT family transporter [Rhodoferax sp.]MDP1944629.1 DMT family transporter [Rhodoferax sp.]MDP2443501.1 DMT family transporter [Rhodoferax sp.]MDZ4208240.1 DMT family transporter [Rhodoferax sp.]